MIRVITIPSHQQAGLTHAFDYLGGDNPVRDAFKMRSAWNIKTRVIHVSMLNFYIKTNSFLHGMV